MIRFHHERIRTFGAMMVIMVMDCFGIHFDQFDVVVVVVVVAMSRRSYRRTVLVEAPLLSLL